MTNKDRKMRESENCINCIFYRKKQCRRFPPSVVYNFVYRKNYYGVRPEEYVFSSNSSFPKTTPKNWCGEFRRKNNL